VRSALDLLEKRGLLLRGGRLIRIVPDLLSDFLLEGACLTGAGDSTGFSDLMFQTFQSTYLSNLLRNLGELDWRITQRNPDQGTRLLDGIWEEIGRAFDAGDASVRVQLFKSLTGAALFQPVRVLRFIHRAIENPAAEVRMWSDFALAQEHVLREMPPLLRGISYHFNHIEVAAEILWRLAKSDTRAPHQYPDHSRRVLEEMADYGRYKPVQFNDWMADFAARKSADPHEFEGTFTPLSIVDKLLEKEGGLHRVRRTHDFNRHLRSERRRGATGARESAGDRRDMPEFGGLKDRSAGNGIHRAGAVRVSSSRGSPNHRRRGEMADG
jgi:hypothetical protein